MSINNCILKTLNLKDKNIKFEANREFSFGIPVLTK